MCDMRSYPTWGERRPWLDDLIDHYQGVVPPVVLAAVNGASADATHRVVAALESALSHWHNADRIAVVRDVVSNLRGEA